jgi:hypothetical protein
VAIVALQMSAAAVAEPRARNLQFMLALSKQGREQHQTGMVCRNQDFSLNFLARSRKGGAAALQAVRITCDLSRRNSADLGSSPDSSLPSAPF